MDPCANWGGEQGEADVRCGGCRSVIKKSNPTIQKSVKSWESWEMTGNREKCKQLIMWKLNV